MSETSSAGITNHCQKYSLEHTVDKLEHNCAIHWVGPRSSSPESKVLLYVHGGGYATPIAQPQISMPMSLVSHIRGPVSLAFLEYSLTIDAKFPTPLIQIIICLSHLLATYPPSQIILGGESSGGHLILALLSFLSHPNPAIFSPSPTLKEPLAGVFILSPLVNRSIGADSYTRNADRDFPDVSKIEAQRATWAPPADMDIPRGFLDPLYADEGWWSNAPVKRVLITTGMWETMQDDCVAFGERWKEEQKGLDIRTVQCPFEVHASCIVEEAFGLSGVDGGSRKVTEAWLEDRGLHGVVHATGSCTHTINNSNTFKLIYHHQYEAY